MRRAGSPRFWAASGAEWLHAAGGRAAHLTGGFLTPEPQIARRRHRARGARCWPKVGAASAWPARSPVQFVGIPQDWAGIWLR
jgi:hypothetical protein